ncbi:hypothetical protein ACQYRI_06485 [Salmonella enterica]
MPVITKIDASQIKLDNISKTIPPAEKVLLQGAKVISAEKNQAALGILKEIWQPSKDVTLSMIRELFGQLKDTLYDNHKNCISEERPQYFVMYNQHNKKILSGEVNASDYLVAMDFKENGKAGCGRVYYCYPD